MPTPFPPRRHLPCPERRAVHRLPALYETFLIGADSSSGGIAFLDSAASSC